MLELGDFKIYNASAGAGKTYTLVKEFISILLKNPNVYTFEHILAITFTNKAANEMKQRILDALMELAAKENSTSPLILDLSKEVSLNVDEVQQRAEKIVIAILHNYSKFSISTIDKFNLRLMKSFSQDLGLSMNFDVEMNTEELLQESVHLLYSKIGEDKELTNTLVDIAIENMDNNKSWDIKRDLIRNTKDLINDRHLSQVNKFRIVSLKDFSDFRKNVYSKTKNLEDQLKELGTKGLELIQTIGLSAADFYYKDRGIPGFFNHLIQENYKMPSNTQIKDLEEKISIEKAKGDSKASLEQIFPQLRAIYTEAIELISQHQIWRQVRSNISSFSIINEIEKSLETLKKEQNILLISEFNTIISKSLQKQPAGFIYERIGSRFHHYFIDEFQDTSTLQWQNLAPLIENARAEGDAVMLVGDAKQSIYRWRGGNPDQMIDLIENRESLNIKVENLPKNWRSHENIIQFNNAFYNFLAPQLNLEAYRRLYETTNNQEKNNKKGGYVQLNFFEKERDESSFKEATLEQILNNIKKAQTNGFSLDEIAVLFRNNQDGKHIAEFLSMHNVPVISSDSLLLINSLEVKTLELLFRIVANTQDRQSKVQFLIHLHKLGKFNPDDLSLRISESLEDEIHSFLKVLKQYQIDLNFIQKENISLYDFTEKAIRNLDLTDQSTAYLLSFLDVVLEYISKNESDINAFLEHWELVKDNASINPPNGIDAVSLMTIHKSKGLEFPIVILPFANWSPRESNIWIPLKKEEDVPFDSFYVKTSKDFKENAKGEVNQAALQEENLTQLDNINMLYVATTRAVEQLYIITERIKAKSTSKSIARYFNDYAEYLGLIEEEEEVILSGEEKRISNPKKEKDDNQKIIRMHSLDWTNRLIINTNSEKMQAQLHRTEYANNLHNILSYIKHEKEIDQAIQKEVLEGNLSKVNQEKIKRSILQIIEHPQLRAYYQPGLKILNERDFIDDKGNLFRADRVVIDAENNCTIIDYKTGKASKKHHAQLNQYADFFHNLGYHIKEKLLVYINNETESIELELLAFE